MPGRYPKPRSLKLLEGNPGKRPIQDEPVPEGRAEKPGWLDEVASGIWDQYAPIVEKMGLLSSADAQMFATWCELAAEFQSLKARMSASHIAQLDKLAGKFGLDPVARARLGMLDLKAKKKANPFKELAG